MKKNIVVWIIICLCALCLGCLLFIHRNVIKALVNGEELPKAPKWHIWVKNRKS